MQRRRVPPARRSGPLRSRTRDPHHRVDDRADAGEHDRHGDRRQAGAVHREFPHLRRAPRARRREDLGVVRRHPHSPVHRRLGLRIVDIDFQGLGTLDSWSLRLNESCPPPSVPPPVPDGSFGTPMHAVRTVPDGSAIQIAWDVSTGPAPGDHLLYGPLAGVSAYTVGGAACTIGGSGTALWTVAPPGNVWFLVVSENGTGMEGTWGRNSSGGDVGGSAPSGLCGTTARLNTPTCP